MLKPTPGWRTTSHVGVAAAAVNSGKPVWAQKPFSLDRESGLGLLKAADAAGIRLGTVRKRHILPQRLLLRIPRQRMGFVEITGTEATIFLPDPNHFDSDGAQVTGAGAPFQLRAPPAAAAWRPGHGPVPFAPASRTVPPGNLAYHVLDTLVSITEFSESGTVVDVESSAPASSALPEDWAPEASTL